MFSDCACCRDGLSRPLVRSSALCRSFLPAVGRGQPAGAAAGHVADAGASRSTGSRGWCCVGRVVVAAVMCVCGGRGGGRGGVHLTRRSSQLDRLDLRAPLSRAGLTGAAPSVPFPDRAFVIAAPWQCVFTAAPGSFDSDLPSAVSTPAPYLTPAAVFSLSLPLAPSILQQPPLIGACCRRGGLPGGDRSDSARPRRRAASAVSKRDPQTAYISGGILSPRASPTFSTRNPPAGRGVWVSRRP